MLVGEPVECCPVACGLGDPEVLRLAALVPGPHGDGDLAGFRPHELPPRYRDVVALARAWRDVVLRRREAER